MSEGTTKIAQMQKKRAKLHFISEFFQKKVRFLQNQILVSYLIITSNFTLIILPVR